MPLDLIFITLFFSLALTTLKMLVHFISVLSLIYSFNQSYLSHLISLDRAPFLLQTGYRATRIYKPAINVVRVNITPKLSHTTQNLILNKHSLQEFYIPNSGNPRQQIKFYFSLHLQKVLFVRFIFCCPTYLPPEIAYARKVLFSNPLHVLYFNDYFVQFLFIRY